jgi:hypothetical protein
MSQTVTWEESNLLSTNHSPLVLHGMNQTSLAPTIHPYYWDPSWTLPHQSTTRRWSRGIMLLTTNALCPPLSSSPSSRSFPPRPLGIALLCTTLASGKHSDKHVPELILSNKSLGKCVRKIMVSVWTFNTSIIPAVLYSRN